MMAGIGSSISNTWNNVGNTCVTSVAKKVNVDLATVNAADDRTPANFAKNRSVVKQAMIKAAVGITVAVVVIVVASIFANPIALPAIGFLAVAIACKSLHSADNSIKELHNEAIKPALSQLRKDFKAINANFALFTDKDAATLGRIQTSFNAMSKFGNVTHLRDVVSSISESYTKLLLKENLIDEDIKTALESFIQKINTVLPNSDN